MYRQYRLFFGLLAAAVLGVGIFGLALMVPGYSQVRQTVSEIGEMGSPTRIPFAMMLFVVAGCILVFASGLREASLRAGHSPLAAYFVAFMTISVIGVGVFAFPHPLHNIFGLSELVGYQAPLILALTWRGDPRPQAKRLVRTSWALFALMLIAIGLNLSTLDRHGALWAYERPFYGLVQRALFAVWFSWCAIIGLMLFEGHRQAQSHALNSRIAP